MDAASCFFIDLSAPTAKPPLDKVGLWIKLALALWIKLVILS
jgi:hypothetical protein